MAFTALDVKKLREQTGCGMKMCIRDSYKPAYKTRDARPFGLTCFSLRVYYTRRRGGGGMRGVIYVDILFFVNALIGYFLLRGAALLAGRIAADWRIFLGAEMCIRDSPRYGAGRAEHSLRPDG